MCGGLVECWQALENGSWEKDCVYPDLDKKINVPTAVTFGILHGWPSTDVACVCVHMFLNQLLS